MRALAIAPEVQVGAVIRVRRCGGDAWYRVTIVKEIPDFAAALEGIPGIEIPVRGSWRCYEVRGLEGRCCDEPWSKRIEQCIEVAPDGRVFTSLMHHGKGHGFAGPILEAELVSAPATQGALL